MGRALSWCESEQRKYCFSIANILLNCRASHVETAVLAQDNAEREVGG